MVDSDTICIFIFVGCRICFLYLDKILKIVIMQFVNVLLLEINNWHTYKLRVVKQIRSSGLVPQKRQKIY